MRLNRVGWLAVPIVAVPILVASAAPAVAAGQTRYVATTGSDTDNDCTDSMNPCATIQYAVDQANAGDTVSVAAGSYPESVDVRLSLTITGAGASTTTVSGDDEEDPSIFVDGIDTQTPPDVTISNLSVSGNSSADGVYVEDGTASVTNAAVSNNADDGVQDDVDSQEEETAASGHVRQPADLTQPQITITSSVISNNLGEGVEEDSGGSVSVVNSVVNGNHEGGVVVEEGSAAVVASTLDSNIGAGVVADGGGTAATVSYSTVSNTVAFTRDEGPTFGGGVAVFPGGSATVSESTIADNTNFGVLDLAGMVQVSNSTVTGTTLGSTPLYEGGLDYLATVPDLRTPSFRSGAAHAAATPADVSLGLTATGTITATNSVPDCVGPVTDGGYNLDSDGSCGLTATGSKSHGNAALGALANNGGPTLTVLPGASSSARNAIPLGSAGCLASAVDQRGSARSNPINSKCDIGAVEAAIVNPKLAVAVSGTHHKDGWYRGTVTVKFTCTLGSAPLTAACPATEHLRASGAHKVTKTIHATDGGRASASTKFKVDNEKPKISVKVVPVHHHNTIVLKVLGTCTDKYSGVASCKIHTHRHGSTVHYTVKARDDVGNKRTKTGKYTDS